MKINSQNNQTLTPTLSQRAMGKGVSFGAIYQQRNVKWTIAQKQVISEIKKTLREPLPEFNGKTAENYYKSKGLDFGLFQHNKKSVYLTACKRAKQVADGKNKKIIFSDSAGIGIYDKDTKFKVSDIKSLTYDKYFRGAAFSAIFAMLAITLSEAMFDNPISKFARKHIPYTEVTDSTADKTKSASPDSTKILKPINDEFLKNSP